MKRTLMGLAGIVLLTSHISTKAEGAIGSVSPIMPIHFGISLPQGDLDDDAAKSKSFSKSFPLSSGEKVNLSNQYGTILIKNWDKKEIKVDIDIRAYSNSDTEAQKLLDEVSIDAEKRSDAVFFRTRISEGSRNWGSWIRNGKRGRKEVKISYVVYMPSSSALTMSQQYGNIDMADQSGPLSVKVQYGNFTAGNLSNANNYINVQYGKTNVTEINKGIVKHQYGSGLNIGSASELNLDAQYVDVNVGTVRESALIKQQYGSGLTMGTVSNLVLDAQYTKVNIQAIKRGNSVIKQQYGSLDIGSSGSLTVKTQYTGVAIGTLFGDATFDMAYDKLSIQKVNENVRSLVVNAEYVNIGVGFADKYSGELDVKTSYSSFRYGSGVTARAASEDDHSQDKNYTGKIGGGGGSRVRIKSSYGNVTFK